MKRLLYTLIAGIVLLSCVGGVTFAQETQKLLSIPKGNILLPVRTVSAYSLEEIARLMYEESGTQFFVDKRVAGKKLLIQPPNDSATPTIAELTEAMRLATGLQWRLVDNIFFLTLYDEDALIEFNRKMAREDKQLRTDIFNNMQKNLGNKIPATLDDFVKGGRSWDGLTPAQQDKYFDLFQGAKQMSGQAD